MGFRLAGVIFICMAGFLYTLERIVAFFSTYVINMGKVGISVDLTVLYPSFFSNPFVTIFLFIGIVCLFLDIKKNKN